MNTSRIVSAVIIITITALVCGACATPSRVADNWGSAYVAQQKGQIANPDAAKNLEPVTGLHGQAAEAALGQYMKSFTGKGATAAGQQRMGTLGIGIYGQQQ